MNEKSVSEAIITLLKNAKNTFELPIIMEFMRQVPIPDRHKEVIAELMKVVRRFGYGGITNPSFPAYRSYHRKVLADTIKAVRRQLPVSV
jgi:hypothetical protein